MDFKSFKKSENLRFRKERFEKASEVVKKITNKILDFYVCNNRWYINLAYFVLFGTVCFSVINGDSNVFGIDETYLTLIDTSKLIFLTMLRYSLYIFAVGLIIRFIFGIIKKVATL